jgi:hypothetical protein
MKKITIGRRIGRIMMVVMALQLGGEIGKSYGAPPIVNEEAELAEAAKEKETEKEKTPEEKKKEKEEREKKANISDVRKRQENDERSIRVRANVFAADSPESQCTAADRARSRLEKVTGEGGVVIMGDVNIASKNDAEVEQNKGSIKNEVNVNIVNQDGKRC